MANVNHELKLKVDTSELDALRESVQDLQAGLVEFANAAVVALTPLLEACQLLLKEDDAMNEASTQEEELGTCDSCDRPATHAARDFTHKPVAEDADEITEYNVGELRRGCDVHPVAPQEAEVGD